MRQLVGHEVGPVQQRHTRMSAVAAPKPTTKSARVRPPLAERRQQHADATGDIQRGDKPRIERR